MQEFRSTIFFTVLVVFLGTILIATWHSMGSGSVPETGLSASDTPRPTAVTAGGTTLEPSQHRDSHLIPAPDAQEIPATGREYEVSLQFYDSIDLALTTRAVRFSGLRTGETAGQTGHECEPIAVREVLASRTGSITTLTARLDRDAADPRRAWRVYIRIIGPNLNTTEVAAAAGYLDADSSGDYSDGDTPAETEVSVRWEHLTGGQSYTAYASLDSSMPTHTTRGTSWVVGAENEAVRDPVVTSRVHAPAGSYVTLSPCLPGASAELLLLDGESLVGHGDGGQIIRVYNVQAQP